MKKTLSLTLTLAISLIAFLPARAQDPASVPQQPTAEDLAKQKAELEKNAYRLLDQVIDESQALHLPENRVRIQLNAADLLWDRNQERGRSLFAQASEGINEMTRTAAPQPVNQRGPQPDRRVFALRQELILAAARHDATLAYQLLAATKSPTPAQNQPIDTRNPRPQFNAEDSLEQTLLGRVAALDPKLAAQNAEQMLEKGQFPRSVGDVINHLQKQDADAAAKLTDKTVKRIQAANLLSSTEAATLAQMLLNPGPRLPAAPTATSPSDSKTTQMAGRAPVLDTSAYTDLLSTVIDAALKATPQAQNNQRAVTPAGRGGPNRPTNVQVQTNQPTQPSDAQIEQGNARRLLVGLQLSLPSIDLYLPGKATAVRQKLTEMGIGDPNRPNVAQAFSVLQQPNADADSLVQAAASAPPQLQSRIYQQAAAKAIEEGNTDRARQIANDHLQASARDSIMQRIDFKEMAKKAEGARLDEIRQNLARLSSDTDKISLLLQVAGDLQKDNPKAQLQVLEEARTIANHRAANYDQFEDQLRVARAFSAVDAARSFEMLEPGIAQLNDLLSAASVLSGFEVNIFRDGEMTVNNLGGSGLNSTIGRYGQELALLAKSDFGRSETLAARFQFTEPRIMAQLLIIKGALGVQPTGQPNAIRNFAPAGNFVIRQE